MKKVLITGSNGLLGQKLIKKIQAEDRRIEIIGVSSGENRLIETAGFRYFSIDISQKESVQSLILKEQPDVVINSAAITNVDICEAEKEKCWAVNVDAVQYIADAVEQVGAHLIHLSTDFIFDGKEGPYKEGDQPNPLSYYGKSKLASEEILAASSCKWSIVRTVLVYGVGENLGRSNIVLWAIGALQNGAKLNVVNDQFRTPTLAEDLADGCWRIAKLGKAGVFNISGKDFMSILELVERIADYFGFSKESLNVISSTTLNQAAKRPPITGFVLDKAILELNYAPQNFEDGLNVVKKQMK